MLESKEIDHKRTSPNAICPYCGTEITDTWEYFTTGSDGDEESITCYRCDKSFIITMNVEVNYSTEKTQGTLELD